MITAEECLDGILNADTIAWNPEIDNVYGCINLAMVEFAKMHVEAALNNIKKETQLWDDCLIVPYEKIVYSLENIK